MNPSQLEACIAKLPPHLAREFERLHREADECMREGWRLRRLAWALYRDQERKL